MDFINLGNTGLRVSVAGLGCGGNSRLGLGAGKTEAQAIALVHAALDCGITFFDTAEAYGTEEVLGRALRGMRRDEVVLSSTSRILSDDGQLLESGAVVERLESSLRRLQTDHLDVYHLHAVHPQHYEHALQEIVPALLRQRDKGVIRHLGITETPPRDPNQVMLSRALEDSCWEVIMLAFHMMNQGPRITVFPRTRTGGVGTLLMFVVRNIFSRPAVLRQTMKELAEAGKVPAELAEREEPLDFLIHAMGASSLTDAAYRFARYEPGAEVILFGTGDESHLRANVASLLKPPLPHDDVEKLQVLFSELSGVGLVFPDGMRSSSV